MACQNYVESVARCMISALKSFIRFLISEGAFANQPLADLNAALKSKMSSALYESNKGQSLSPEIGAMFNFNICFFSRTKAIPKEPSSLVLDNLKQLETHLKPNVFELVSSYILTSGVQKQKTFSRCLLKYIQPLSEGLNSKNLDTVSNSLSYVTTNIATTTNSLSTFNSHMGAYVGLMRHLVDSDYFGQSLSTELVETLRRRTIAEYEERKTMFVPDEFLAKIPEKLSADKELELVLESTCTPEIGSRLKEHVNSFKSRKAHRAPLIAFLNQISSSDSKWYEHPKVVQGELIKFRGNLLDDSQRNTAYWKFQNVKNALEALVNHDLLPDSIDLPDNLRRDTNAEKIRDKNPLISNTNLYEEDSLGLFSDSKKFIEHLEKDIENNLSLLISEAQEIVHDAYHKFCNAPKLIERSEYDEFMAHPDKLVRRDGSKTVRCKNDYYIGAFVQDNLLRVENSVAFLSNNYNKLSSQSAASDIQGTLAVAALPYLGLTTYVASAMQTIITEEIGINPYSLYSAKVTSTGHGAEFIQVDDEGSVRLRTLKPRARYAGTRRASGSLMPLNEISVQDIDAATCLKMAIEMTSRAREVEQNNSLWLCLSKFRIISILPENFQNRFKLIRKKVAKKSKVDIINYATLKKVRTSKGVLIYIKSNGDSLKTATYLGNTVKTTLARYIPKYLTELIYRLKIRSFQRVLLFMAISNDESPIDSLKLSKDKFMKQLEIAFTNPEMGGNLFDKLTKEPKNNDDEQNIYFCVSDNNLQLAIKYTSEGEDMKLKKMCEDVIHMISESNTPLKLMLRKAQKAVE